MKKSDDAVVISLVAVAHGVSHFFQLIAAPLFPLIKDDLGVSYAALGFALALFYTVSAIGQPIAGFVVDRFGARTVLMAGVALEAFGVLAMGLSHGYPTFVAGAALAGLGNSVFHPADFTILNSRVAPARLGYAFSAHGVSGSLGYAAAPAVSGALGALFGWHTALMVAAGLGLVVLAALASQAHRLHTPARPQAEKRIPLAQDVRVLMSAPVVLCFLYFAVYAAGLVGVQSFSVTAITLQFDVPATLASGALTAYMVASAAGIFAGGFIATRVSRHDLVAASGLGAGAIALLMVAMGQVPGGALPVAFAIAGFMLGATGPSRDLIVRAATPVGSTGKVYGFVYSGLDFGSVATPVIYGWLLDHRMPQAVFYVIATLTALAIFTVLQVPSRKSGTATDFSSP